MGRLIKFIWMSRGRPNFWHGVSRVFDLGARGSRTCDILGADPVLEDLLAMESDWRSVGNDMAFALKKFADERTANGQQ